MREKRGKKKKKVRKDKKHKYSFLRLFNDHDSTTDADYSEGYLGRWVDKNSEAGSAGLFDGMYSAEVTEENYDRAEGNAAEIQTRYLSDINLDSYW